MQEPTADHDAANRVFVVEYLWCSGADTHHDLRSKVKTCQADSAAELSYLMKTPEAVAGKLPEWNFDGSSTRQAKAGSDTEILLRPVVTFPHPFIKDIPAFVALSECFLPSGEPTPDNTRFVARSVFEHKQAQGLDPWFGLEQEYVLTHSKNGLPLGWPSDMSEPEPQGPYYCSSGSKYAHGRRHAMEHYGICLKMGLKVSGINAEVMPGQWEYQIGPCRGIESGDHTLVSRWVYLRLLEDDCIDVDFSSKPRKGDWNGSGMHCNLSTEPMRRPGGYEEIKKSISRLEKTFLNDIAVYGSDNIERLSGKHETSSLDCMTWGVGTRHTSVRVPNGVARAGCGYFEDRRPSASADPYLITARLYASACGIPAERIDQVGDATMPKWLQELRMRK